MRIIGCDLHARQQNVGDAGHCNGRGSGSDSASTKATTCVGSLFLASTPGARVGIEAMGSMQWFVNLMEELGIECLVGHPAEIRAAEPRKQKHDRRDAELILKMLVVLPLSGDLVAFEKELQDLRSLLRHRHQWVRMRTRIQNCAAKPLPFWRNGLRRGTALWSHDGQSEAGSPRCRWRSASPIGGASCRRCTRSSKRRSRN